jgi:flavodoxin
MKGRLVRPGVLVAYATKHGSTREVADAVSKTLRAEGIQVVMVRDRIELPAFSFSAWRCGHAAWYH